MDEKMSFSFHRCFSFILLSLYRRRSLLFGGLWCLSPKYHHVGDFPAGAGTHKTVLIFLWNCVQFLYWVSSLFCLWQGVNPCLWAFCVTGGEWCWVGLWLYTLASNLFICFQSTSLTYSLLYLFSQVWGFFFLFFLTVTTSSCFHTNLLPFHFS